MLISSFFTVTPFYLSAILSYYVSIKYPSMSVLTIGMQTVVFITVLTIVVLFYRVIVYARENKDKEKAKRISTLSHAYVQMQRLTIDRINRNYSENPQNIFTVSTADIQKIVDLAYNTFEASYGTSDSSDNRIDFEVTFMTKSYRDNKITIPASANRDRRSPISMLGRSDNNTIYDNTVTALVYRETRPHTRIIEDTSNPDVEYQELYSGQSQRIKSSIVHPVLSERNRILGTLVVHCDAKNFFKKDDIKYWQDVLEVFAKELALLRLKFDQIFETTQGQGEFVVKINSEETFF